MKNKIYDFIAKCIANIPWLFIVTIFTLVAILRFLLWLGCYKK